MLRFIDAHAHLHDEAFDGDRSAVFARMKEAGVGAITVGTTLASSRAAVALAEEEENVWATIGIHPTDSEESFDAQAFEVLVRREKTVGIGECGLDYFRGMKTSDEKERQRALFERQIGFAEEFGKPIMIHGRPSRGTQDAYEDILGILERRKGSVRGNVHFFAGSAKIARRFLELGFTLSFTGVVTFARDYDEAIRNIPEESILAETDSPYVSPAPLRGERNDPSRVALVAEELARIRGEDQEGLRLRLLGNTRRVFGLPAK